MWMATLVGFVLALLAFFAWLIPSLRDWFGANPAYGWVGLLAAVVVVAWFVVDRWRLLDEIRALRDKVNSLERPAPSERDRELTVKVLDAWDPHGLLFGFLRHGFNAKRWSGDNVEPLYTFVRDFEYCYFDDPPVQAAFKRLYKAATDLAEWTAIEAAPIAEDNQGRAPDEPLIYSIREADLVGGWKEFDDLREKGLAQANITWKASREFEEVARARGL